jgi:thioredoxin reductase (NADPH)
LIWDCIVIGGGPAGLTAATYLARYRRSVLLIDAGDSRAGLIPETHNHPAFRGISGAALLQRLRHQLDRYDAAFKPGTVTELRRGPESFDAATEDSEFASRRVLLATGIKDIGPDLPGLEPAVLQSIVRYCPICDGYEAMDRRIAVYGPIEGAHRKALFLRTYSNDVTILPTADVTDRAAIERSRSNGIDIIPTAPARFARTAKGVRAVLPDATAVEFDVLYPALGAEVRSDLARQLGAACAEDGYLQVGARQETTVPGLYAAGDAVSDLHQLCVAEGHGAVAATAIHNSLPFHFR